MIPPPTGVVLGRLIGPELEVPAGCESLPVAGLTADSRKIVPGVVFAAIPGTKVDGAKFAANAADKGAVAILAAREAVLPPLQVPVLRAADPRRALALMAARLYGRQPEVVVAVTGTSGKTSVADFSRQILAACGRQAASLGTLGVVKPSGAVYGSLTTPDPVTLSSTLEIAESDAAALMMSFTRWSYSTSTSSVNRRITLLSLLPSTGTLERISV